MLHPRKVSFFDKAGRTSKRPALAGRFELQGHLQFLQFLASEAFLEAFACLPAFALELSLAAEACLPFALDPVFSMFTPLGDHPVFRLLPVEGSMPLHSWFYTSPAGELFPRAPLRGCYTLALPYFFIIEMRRALRLRPQRSAQYYIKVRGRGA